MRKASRRARPFACTGRSWSPGWWVSGTPGQRQQRTAGAGQLRRRGRNGTASGTLIVLEPCSASAAGEIWKAGVNGTWVNPGSGMCLTDPGGSTANGTQLDITACQSPASRVPGWATAARG
jgi:hypothetical protein